MKDTNASINGKPIVLCTKHNVTTTDYCGECLRERERITFGPCETPSYARDLGCRICWKELGNARALAINVEQVHEACYEDHKNGHNGDTFTQCGFCRNAEHYGTVRTVAMPDFS